jgi:molybdopterin/thiamine biosynthesis adenylyltransferase/rhodanese-related sulfurtransferase
MLTDSEKERYSRQLILQGFGADAQQKLKQSSILVIGTGGLGCPALTYLASAGIGTIGIADDDKVALSNLPRQILYTTDDVGEYKVIASKQRLTAMNPHCNITIYKERVTRDNVLQMMKAYDVVVDGSDNFQTRYLLNDACVMLKKPLVYGAISGFEGQVSVFNYNNGPTYRCLFPEPPAPGDMPSCNEAGVVGVLPGIIGTMQATEAIKILTGIGTVLSGKLLTIDLLKNQTNYFDVAVNEANRNITELGTEEYYCNSSEHEINMSVYNAWKEQKKVQLIDVRSTEEFLANNTGGINIPVDELKEHFTEIDPSSVLVVRCQTGKRARKAIEVLKSEFKATPIYLLKTV